VPELVWSLVDKSLVVAESAEGGTRYRLLESIRTYARKLLDARGETAESAQRLATWYLSRLGPRRTAGRAWVNAMAAELDNLRAVGSIVATTDEGQAQELACSIGRYHESVQSFRDGIAELARLSGELRCPTPARVALLTTLGDLHLRMGDVASAERVARTAEAVRHMAGTPGWDDVGVEKTYSEIAILRHQPEQAAEIATRTLRRHISLRGQVRMHNVLGIACISMGEVERATAAFRGELETAELLGDEVFLSRAQANAAELALRVGDREAAAHHQRACLDLAIALGQMGMVAYTFNVAARLLVAGSDRAATDWGAAVRLSAKAEALLDDTGLALYDEDRRVTDEMLRSARDALGGARYDAEELHGRALDVGQAIEIAQQVLRTVVANRFPSSVHP
jgi:hypothetical protein